MLPGVWKGSAALYPARAEAYLRRWYFWATHSPPSPIVMAARTIKRHLPNILTNFKRRITNAVAEGQ